MENKILHTILNIIKLSKTQGTSYYKIKRNIVKLKFEINLKDYLNYLLKNNCIEKKKINTFIYKIR